MTHVVANRVRRDWPVPLNKRSYLPRGSAGAAAAQDAMIAQAGLDALEKLVGK